MPCPQLWADSVDLIGTGTFGAASFDGGNKIVLNDGTKFYVFDRRTQALISSHFLWEPNWRANFTVTDDGVAWYWSFTAAHPTEYALTHQDLVGGLNFSLLPGINDFNILDGPSWNPYDGLLYDTDDPPGAGSNMNLLQIDVDDVTNFNTISLGSGWSSASDGCVFTPDGAIWFMVNHNTSPFAWVLRRFDPDAFVHTSLETGLTQYVDLPVPTKDNTVLLYDHNDDVTREWGPGGAVGTSACGPFGSTLDPPREGTARVHTGVDGLVTFLYPTLVGGGRYVYLFEQRRPRWRVGVL